MRIRTQVGIVGAGPAGLAAAQVPTSGNVFFGYSYYNTDISPIDRANTNGWEGSLEGKVFPHIGIVADFSGHYGSENFPIACAGSCSGNVNITEENVLFGPRCTAAVGTRIAPWSVLINSRALTN